MINTSKTPRVSLLLILIIYLTPFIFLSSGVMTGSAVVVVCVIYTLALGLYYHPEIKGVIGNIYFASGNETRASRYYKKAILSGTTLATVYLNYAVILLKANDNESALSHLKAARLFNAKYSVDKNIMLSIANAYASMGMPDPAIETLKQTKLKYDYVGPDIEAALGYLYFLKKDYATATDVLLNVTATYQTHAIGFDNLGLVYFHTSQFDRAKAAFLSALSLDEHLVDSNFFLGLIYEKENDLISAKSYFEKSHHLTPLPIHTATKSAIDNKYWQYFR